jgi:hypothetical protein
LNYSRRCAEASAVQAYQKRGLPLALGMEIGYVETDAAKWKVDTERDASEFDSGYYGTLLEKAWMIWHSCCNAIFRIDHHCKRYFTRKNVRISLSPHLFIECC